MWAYDLLSILYIAPKRRNPHLKAWRSAFQNTTMNIDFDIMLVTKSERNNLHFMSDVVGS